VSGTPDYRRRCLEGQSYLFLSPGNNDSRQAIYRFDSRRSPVRFSELAQTNHDRIAAAASWNRPANERNRPLQWGAGAL